jgi:uroporphyrin-III C-methyltransferase/precorrin-2 dehydrogenase/sirohydrochlorin ferrochelatase
MKPQSRSPQLSNTKRIEALAVLPVFLDLHGKSAMVVGASEGALWKAELLLQAGARVTLACETPTAAALQWVSNAEVGRAKIVISPWREISFSAVFLVVADVSKAEASDLVVKARATGTIVNIVDQPDYCQFQFGSVVNKSPLVIGISTGGAAPVLAQLVRSLIEAALPERLQTLALKARALRPRINQRLRGADQRRRYWNAFFSRAFGMKSKGRDLDTQTYSIAASEVGDLTLRDLEMLRRADRVSCQGDVNPAVTSLARREAIRETRRANSAEPGPGKILLTFGAASPSILG